MPRYVTACKLSILTTLAALLTITFLIFSCGSDETQEQTPAPAPIDISAITTQIQQTIRDELAMMPPPLSEAEIRSLIEDAVSNSVPKAISYAEIQAMVDSAVAAAYSGEEEGYRGEAAAEASTGRLEAIQQRGRLVCASNDNMAGFGFVDAAGNTVGFDVDLCRAVAAAVLGDANAVEFRPTTAFERGPSLQSGEIDMISRNTTWTTSRDARWGNFAQTMFYDGQGFIVPKSLEVSSVSELEGASICVLRGTTTELNLQDFNAQNNMGFTIVPFDDSTSAIEAYLQGQCDSLSTDQSGLLANAAGFPDLSRPRYSARNAFRGTAGNRCTSRGRAVVRHSEGRNVHADIRRSFQHSFWQRTHGGYGRHGNRPAIWACRGVMAKMRWA